ncbi:MAG: RNA polymerase sigma factor [Prevotella sp.]|nr:RNA polymerase sigma factor [Candidatus Prevotella equi]
MDEQQLLRDLHNNSTRRRAFEVLVNQYSEKLYWTARHIVGVHEDADDVLQNAFIKIWNKLDEFRGDSKLSTWLHRIVVNEALDHIRREKKHMNDTDISELKKNFADTYFDGDEAEQLLRDAMETLPDAQRAVFVLKYFEGKQYKEISAILGTSEGGLKANYHYAVEKIRKYIFPDKD